MDFKFITPVLEGRISSSLKDNLRGLFTAFFLDGKTSNI